LNRQRIILLLPLVLFASFESGLAILGALQFTGGPQQPFPPTPLTLLWTYSPHLSILSWIAVVGAAIYFGRSGRGIFARKGFQTGVYDLMVKMRGGESRMALLRNLETPRHRFDLSEITGLDWKEVDRQLSVLENYGLVKIYVQSGSVKLYQLTEQGRVLIKLIDDLGDNSSPHDRLEP
jgi:DNA-binding transcriptional ArsR family regulator